MSKLKLWFHLMLLFCLEKWTVVKLVGMLGQTSSRGSTVSSFTLYLPMICGATRLALNSTQVVRTFTVRTVSRQVRRKSEDCSALSLKPKQDYLFNFPNTCRMRFCSIYLTRSFPFPLIFQISWNKILFIILH